MPLHQGCWRHDDGPLGVVAIEQTEHPDRLRRILSVMVIAGMYEDSGLWWTRVGLPAKSGVSGAILAVVPGWGAIAAYSPRLDEAGNGVRAALAIRELAERWDLHSIDRLILLEPKG
jgi:glutaminase